MKRYVTLLGALSLFLLAALVSVPSAKTQNTEKALGLNAVGPASGPFGRSGQAGTVNIEVENGRTSLQFSVSGLTPNAVHGVWLILNTGGAPFVSCSGPSCMGRDAATGTTATVYPFTPAAADNAGFKAGRGLDPNGFVTDAGGNANFEIEINYDIFQPGVAPLVLFPGTTQTVAVAPSSGTCAASGASSTIFPLDSAYMSVFNTSTVANLPGTSPAYPLLDSAANRKLVRANVAAIVIVEHFDGLTHGHVPGNGVVGNPCGDHAGRLRGLLSAAVPEDSLPEM